MNLTLFLTCLVAYLIIYYIFFNISFYFIFEKAYIKGYYAFIPFVNMYYFMKVCHLSWWWIFIPGINVLVSIFCPMLIAYHFGQKRILGAFGVLLPILFYLYIAFDKNVKYIHRKLDDLNLKKVSDIDNLEKDIIEKSSNYHDDMELQEECMESSKTEEKALTSGVEEMIEKIETSYANEDDNEEIIDEDFALEKPKVEVKQEIPSNLEHLLEIDDDADIISLDNLEKTENKSIEDNKLEMLDNSDYKEIEKQKEDVIDVAFKKSQENEKVKQEKELVCPNCGSSLVGYHDYCPGCNMDIRHLTSN